MAKGTAAGAATRERVKPGIWRRLDASGKLRYEISYRDSDGRQRRETVLGGLREAETALADKKARMGRGQRIAPNPRLTFEAAAGEWFDAKATNLTPKTQASYRYGLDTHLLPQFGRRRLQDIDVSTVAKFVATMQTAAYRREVQTRAGRDVDVSHGYAVETIKSVLIPLSRTFAYATRHMGYSGENPVSALDLDERPGYGQHKRRKPKLGRDELDRLIESARSPWREIIATAVALGTRMGETLGLQWRDIDFDRGLVSVRRQANAKRQLARLKTETADRRIEAPAWLMAMFASWKLRSAFCDDNDLVFATRTGRPHGHGNVLARGLYPALDRAGLPRTSFHSLRHTHASLWIKDGGDVITLSKRLGHATPQVTMTTYANEIEEATDNAARMARVDAMFARTQMARAWSEPSAGEPRPASHVSLSSGSGEVVPLVAIDDVVAR